MYFITGPETKPSRHVSYADFASLFVLHVLRYRVGLASTSLSNIFWRTNKQPPCLG